MSTTWTNDRDLSPLTAEAWDLIVIGGGVVGAGVARDAALRGLRTLLVERRDFASGTSSRSSRLLHGGLRYLAQGRVGLVREASREKRIIGSIAPHLCQPLAFIFPAYRGGAWPRWQLSVGVKLYDALCGGKNFGRSKTLTAAEVGALLPQLRAEGLAGAVRYFDALTSDARLVLDSLRSAVAAGARIVNYAAAVGAERSVNTWRCEIEDALTGRRYQAPTATIVNAAGPWADRLAPSAVRLRLTKGVHLLLDRARFAVPDAVVLTEGSRILFAIPWGDTTILGTTDTDYTGDPDDVHTDADDVAYVLRAADAAFPAARLKSEDVVGSWAGLRPLIATGRGGPSDISRAHEIRSPQPGWIDVAGGKLTTYRLIAEQTVDRVVRHLNAPTAPCRTAELPLLPPEETAGRSGVIPPAPTRELVEHFCREEWAVHLDDVMLRRGGWHYSRREAAATAEQVADWMGAVLAWSDAQRVDELARYRALRP